MGPFLGVPSLWITLQIKFGQIHLSIEASVTTSALNRSKNSESIIGGVSYLIIDFKSIFLDQIYH